MELNNKTTLQLSKARPRPTLLTWDTEQYHIFKGGPRTVCGREVAIHDRRLRTLWPHQAHGLTLCPRCWDIFLERHQQPKLPVEIPQST